VRIGHVSDLHENLRWKICYYQIPGTNR
jgi:hypothetical protein